MIDQNTITEHNQAQHAPIERRNMDDLRDRISRAEQNITNLKENFLDFKLETRAEFKTLSDKIDVLIDEMGGIKVAIAKYIGIGMGAVAVIQISISVITKFI